MGVLVSKALVPAAAIIGAAALAVGCGGSSVTATKTVVVERVRTVTATEAVGGPAYAICSSKAHGIALSLSILRDTPSAKEDKNFKTSLDDMWEDLGYYCASFDDLYAALREAEVPAPYATGVEWCRKYPNWQDLATVCAEYR